MDPLVDLRFLNSYCVMLFLAQVPIILSILIAVVFRNQSDTHHYENTLMSTQLFALALCAGSLTYFYKWSVFAWGSFSYYEPDMLLLEALLLLLLAGALYRKVIIIGVQVCIGVVLSIRNVKTLAHAFSDDPGYRLFGRFDGVLPFLVVFSLIALLLLGAQIVYKATAAARSRRPKTSDCSVADPACPNDGQGATGMNFKRLGFLVTAVGVFVLSYGLLVFSMNQPVEQIKVAGPDIIKKLFRFTDNLEDNMNREYRRAIGKRIMLWGVGVIVAGSIVALSATSPRRRDSHLS